MIIHIGLRELGGFIRILHCPIRWDIIEILGEGAKSTSEIQGRLEAFSREISRPSLYYHLSELERGGIIGVAGYREKGGGAPEKIWELKAEQIIIDLIQRETSKDKEGV